MIAKRKNISNINPAQKGVRTGGYWYRNRAVWPKATLYSVEMGDNAHFESNISERYLPLATGLANYYGGEFSDRIQRLAVALFGDVYHNPQSTLEMVLRDPECAREYGSDLFGVLNVIGEFNIFFDNGFVKKETIGASEEIAKGLYLSRKRLGMPVKAFLLYFKGGNLRPEDLSVLAGIPARYIQWAYNILTTYMWEVVDGLHQRKAEEKASQREKPVIMEHEDPRLLVDFSKPSRRMTGEMLDDATADAVDLMEKKVQFDQVPFVPDSSDATSDTFDADDFSE